MNRNRLVIAALVTAVAAAGLSSWAAEGKRADGRQLYREFCKPCHAKGSPHGEYTPMSLIQDQWEEFFEETYPETHPGLAVPAHGGRKLEKLLTPEMLEKIREFAIGHAADSERPMTCG